MPLGDRALAIHGAGWAGGLPGGSTPGRWGGAAGAWPFRCVAASANRGESQGYGPRSVDAAIAGRALALLWSMQQQAAPSGAVRVAISKPWLTPADDPPPAGEAGRTGPVPTGV
jgi:hypothetical protein